MKTPKRSRLAELDIASEAAAQQDGLAERLQRRRAAPTTPTPSDANAWRRNKALLQVAIPEEAHVELGIIAKRRRTTLSQLTKDALNAWLEAHGHPLRITS